jgi:hypothetical protein
LKQIPQIAKDNKTTERRDCGSRKYLQNTAVFQRSNKLIRIKHYLQITSHDLQIQGAFQREDMDLLQLAMRYFGDDGRLNTFTIHQQLDLPEARS